MVPPLRCVLCVVLFNNTINDDYTWYYNICSAWFLDIRISTCFMEFINIGPAYIRGWVGGVWGWDGQWQRLKQSSKKTNIVEFRGGPIFHYKV